MIQQKLTYLLLPILLYSCSSVDESKYPKLEHTKWVHEYFEGCGDTYEFTTATELIWYSCETEDTVSGKYYYEKDTLIMEEYANYPAGYTPAPNTDEMPEKVKYKLYYNKDGKLQIAARYNWIDGRYVYSGEVFDMAYERVVE